MEVVVFSRTLAAGGRPGVRVVSGDPAGVVRGLKASGGRDIWLFGGGALCRSLLDAGLVDSVEVAVMPVALGAGIPLIAPGSPVRLALGDHRVLPSSGIVVLSYAVVSTGQQVPRISYVRSRT
jgi:dihydrofolate reductase